MKCCLVLALCLATLRVDGFAPTASVVRTKPSYSQLIVNLETQEKTGQDSAKGSFSGPGGPDLTPDNDDNSNKPLLPENALVNATAVLGTAAVATQAGAYAEFFQALSQMKENVADPADFWPAVNFWIFFAVGHAILQPIFWISEVLHASPGPMVGNLVPITFILGNLAAIAAFTLSKEVRSTA